ncbi:hypothetical protein [Methylobacterium sp. 1973]|uniref:hypothetical protein n=1 Tax=Methylobacterium sp. 1973 TaxID=3156421 RepID=UPI003398D24C
MDLDDRDAVVDTCAGPQGTDAARRQTRFAGLDVPDRPDRRCAGPAIPEKNIRASAAGQAVADDVAGDEALLDTVPADPGEIQRAQAGRQAGVDLEPVEEPLSRLGARDDVLQDIEDLIGLRIDPRITRSVLANDGGRPALSAPPTIAAPWLIRSESSFDVQKFKGNEDSAQAKLREGIRPEHIGIMISHRARTRRPCSCFIP